LTGALRRGRRDGGRGIEAAILAAPGAQVTVYEGPSSGAGGGFQAVLNEMISDGVNIISNNFGYCEDQTTLADAQSIDAVLATAAASGITVFNATGDSGSTCSDNSANTIPVPADSPHAIAVGASSLTVGSPGPMQARPVGWVQPDPTHWAGRIWPECFFPPSFLSGGVERFADAVGARRGLARQSGSGAENLRG
jgi:hypothetical protein